MKEICPIHPNAPPPIVGKGTPPHAASLRCSQCNQFIKWLPKFDSRLKNLAFLTPPPPPPPLKYFS